MSWFSVESSAGRSKPALAIRRGERHPAEPRQSMGFFKKPAAFRRPWKQGRFASAVLAVQLEFAIHWPSGDQSSGERPVDIFFIEQEAEWGLPVAFRSTTRSRTVVIRTEPGVRELRAVSENAVSSTYSSTSTPGFPSLARCPSIGGRSGRQIMNEQIPELLPVRVRYKPSITGDGPKISPPSGRVHRRRFTGSGAWAEAVCGGSRCRPSRGKSAIVSAKAGHRHTGRTGTGSGTTFLDALHASISLGVSVNADRSYACAGGPGALLSFSHLRAVLASAGGTLRFLSRLECRFVWIHSSAPCPLR